jgi:hypothetical protein
MSDVSPYLDDMHGLEHQQHLALIAKDACVQLFLDMGFMINLKKSILTPTQDMIHLGGRVMTNVGIVRLPEAKAHRIVQAARELLHARHVTARHFMSVTGQMTACLNMIAHCMLYVRPLTMHLMSQYVPGVDSLTTRITLLDPEFRQALSFWTVPANLLVGIPLGHVTDHIVVSTDASLVGWGAHCPRLRRRLSGIWTPIESLWDINLLELEAVNRALHLLVDDLSGRHVIVQTDNASVVAYLTHDGGMRSPRLNHLTRTLILWCLQHEISVTAVHIPGTGQMPLPRTDFCRWNGH